MSRSKKEPFAALAQNEEELAAYTVFGRSFQEHVKLPAGDVKRMEKCFSEALEWYREQGLAPEEAVRRLDPAQLGGFYVRPADRWFPLDEAAVIYPIIASGDVMGAVVMLTGDTAKIPTNVETKLAQSAAAFLGKQMEE